MSIKTQKLINRIASLTLVIVWSIIVIIPLTMLVFVALKTPAELAANPFSWPQDAQWGIFAETWVKADLGKALRNSLIVTVSSLAILVFFGASAAYPLARRTRSTPLFYYFLAGIMVPFQLAMLPLYRLMKTFHLINTFHGVIFIYVATSLPFVIFLYTGFIKGINRELEDAAMVDGAGRMRMFWTIIFPLLKPVTATVIIMTGISLWNDFFIALLFLPKRGMRTLQLALFTFVGQYNNDWQPIFAAVILSILPMIIVFLLLQKYFIKGIASGAVKG
jgi:raffinose/stachyose/melibiose transport system permease protein